MVPNDSADDETIVANGSYLLEFADGRIVGLAERDA